MKETIIQITDDSIGKKFKRRDGVVVECNGRYNDEIYPYYFSDTSVRTPDGKYTVGGDHSWDVISQVIEPTNNPMKETIENVITEIKDYPISPNVLASIRLVLEKHISKLNPNRIDEERFMDIHSDVPYKHIYDVLAKYNSTLPEPLVRFPEEMPGWFHSRHTIQNLWDMVCLNYGTPQKELPSVEKLAQELSEWFVTVDCVVHWDLLAQHLISKYKLDAKKDVFPFNLKKGDKFMVDGKDIEIFDHLSLTAKTHLAYDVIKCHPYTEPSMRDKIKALGATDEMIDELVKEVGGG